MVQIVLLFELLSKIIDESEVIRMELPTLLLSSFAYKNLSVQHVHQLQKKKLSRSPNICFIPCKQIKNMHGFTKYN